MPSPDPQAAELRNRLVVILSKVAEAKTVASPAPNERPAPAAELDAKLADEFKQWRKDYDQWLKGAARTYNSPH